MKLATPKMQLHKKPDPRNYRGGYQPSYATTLPCPPKAASAIGKSPKTTPPAKAK